MPAFGAGSLAVSMHHDLLYRFACWQRNLDKRLVRSSRESAGEDLCRCPFFQTVGDRSTGNGGLADVLAHADQRSIPESPIGEVEGQCLPSFFQVRVI